MFSENLPGSCPPTDASDVEFTEVWRVVSGPTLGVSDFYSHAKLKIVRLPMVSECDHASCSLFTSRDKVSTLAKRLPKTRFENPYVVKLSIPEGSGMSLQNTRTGHVHFWMFSSFDPLTVADTPEIP
jgi:hypothetical protein